MSGHGKFRDRDSTNSVEPGSFGLLPPGADFQFTAAESLRLLTLQKRYEPARGIEMFKSIHGQESHIEKKVWADNPHSLLQTLIPDEIGIRSGHEHLHLRSRASACRLSKPT